jgi:hypothetical protein
MVTCGSISHISRREEATYNAFATSRKPWAMSITSLKLLHLGYKRIHFMNDHLPPFRSLFNFVATFSLPKFRFRSDWRSHFAMMGKHHSKITELMAQLAQLAPTLAKVGADVTRAVESIQTREKALNTGFQTTIAEYAARNASLEQIEKQ